MWKPEDVASGQRDSGMLKMLASMFRLKPKNSPCRGNKKKQLYVCG